MGEISGYSREPMDVGKMSVGGNVLRLPLNDLLKLSHLAILLVGKVLGPPRLELWTNRKKKPLLDSLLKSLFLCAWLISGSFIIREFDCFFLPLRKSGVGSRKSDGVDCGSEQNLALLGTE